MNKQQRETEDASQKAANAHMITLESVGRALPPPRERKLHQGYVPLSEEVRSHVDTACAAFHLGRRPQTMRAWACMENGPIRPKRINGRLAWSTAEIRSLLF